MATVTEIAEDIYRINIEADITDRLSLYTELVADPWSVVGKTSETIVFNDSGSDHFRVQLKY